MKALERKELLAALRAKGFKRSWRDRGGGRPSAGEVVGYEMREGAVTYTVQVWPEGGRCSHRYNGTAICKPTEFGGRAGLGRALAAQRRLVAKTKAHWDHYHG